MTQVDNKIQDPGQVLATMKTEYENRLLDIPMSEAWRVNKSSINYVEMANALNALAKIVGHLNYRKPAIMAGQAKVELIETVEFNQKTKEGMSYNEGGKHIVIDPTFAKKATPIEPHDFDTLCGLTIHEVAHTLASSQSVMAPGKRDPSPHSEEGVIRLEDVNRIGEEIYCDNFIRRHFSPLYPYLLKARRAYSVYNKDVNYNNLMDHWLVVSVYHETMNMNVDKGVLKGMEILLGLSGTLVGGDHTPAKRLDLYTEAFRQLQLAIKSLPNWSGGAKKSTSQRRGKKTVELDTNAIRSNLPPIKPGDEEGQEGEGQKAENPKGKKPALDYPSFHNSETVSKEMAKKIKNSQENETLDISQEIRTYSNRAGSVVMEQSKAEPMDETISDMRPELTWLKSLKNSMGRQTIRNEYRGDIDGRNLYRGPIDRRIYKTTRRLPNNKRDIVLILDTSGSMRKNKMVFHAANTVHSIIPDSHVYGYGSPDGQKVHITYLTGQGRMKRPVLDGETPSGSAIIAVAMKHPTALLIHFTDGVSNLGIPMIDCYRIVETQFPSSYLLSVEFGRSTYENQIQKKGENISVVQILDLKAFPKLLVQSIRDNVRSGF